MFTHDNVGRNLFVISKYFKLYLKNSLKEYDLNTAEGLSLLVLYQQEGQTQDEIIQELHYDKGVMARTMQSLEIKEYVIKKNNVMDNRSFVYELTNTGRELKPIIIQILKNWNQMLLKDIDPARVDLVQEISKQMVSNVIYEK